MGPAPFTPIHDTRSFAFAGSLRKGSSVMKTLAGRATNIMNSPSIMAGTATAPICDGLVRRPSISTIRSCPSHEMPSKNLSTSLFSFILPEFPSVMADTYSARRPLPPIREVMPSLRKAHARISMLTMVAESRPTFSSTLAPSLPIHRPMK